LQSVELRIDPELLIPTSTPLLFTMNTQFESWLSTLIWSRTVVNHIGEIFDSESLVQFPLFTGLRAMEESERDPSDLLIMTSPKYLKQVLKDMQ